jgi:hypothetical protein
MSHSISPERQEVQAILKPLFDYYRQRELAIARVAYRRGATVSDIAKELGVTHQAASAAYPKTKLLGITK